MDFVYSAGVKVWVGKNPKPLTKKEAKLVYRNLLAKAEEGVKEITLEKLKEAEEVEEGKEAKAAGRISKLAKDKIFLGIGRLRRGKLLNDLYKRGVARLEDKAKNLRKKATDELRGEFRDKIKKLNEEIKSKEADIKNKKEELRRYIEDLKKLREDLMKAETPEERDKIAHSMNAIKYTYDLLNNEYLGEIREINEKKKELEEIKQEVRNAVIKKKEGIRAELMKEVSNFVIKAKKEHDLSPEEERLLKDALEKAADAIASRIKIKEVKLPSPYFLSASEIISLPGLGPLGILAGLVTIFLPGFFPLGIILLAISSIYFFLNFHESLFILRRNLLAYLLILGFILLPFSPWLSGIFLGGSLLYFTLRKRTLREKVKSKLSKRIGKIRGRKGLPIYTILTYAGVGIGLFAFWWTFRFLTIAGIQINTGVLLVFAVINTVSLILLWHLSEGKSLEELKKKYLSLIHI